MSTSAPLPSLWRATLGPWYLLRACLRVRQSKTHGLGESQMRLVAFPVLPLLRRSCGESQSWSFSPPHHHPRVVIRDCCCTVVLFSDVLVTKTGASLVCSGASSLWVAILPSLCSSQGACARNSASSRHFFAVSSHDVFQWLLIGGTVICGCFRCSIVVHCWSHPCSQYFP